MQGKEGWNAERLAPLLVGLFELLPWLKQWHNEKGPGGRGVADDYEQFLHDEARSLGAGHRRPEILGACQEDRARARTESSPCGVTDEASYSDPSTF